MSLKAPFYVLLPALLLPLMLGACQTTDEMLDTHQAEAIETALVRVRFEKKCPGATAQVLSRKIAWASSARVGMDRSVFTLGIDACGDRLTTVVVCPLDDSGCIAADSD